MGSEAFKNILMMLLAWWLNNI